jgi:hypothetical protein
MRGQKTARALSAGLLAQAGSTAPVSHPAPPMSPAGHRPRRTPLFVEKHTSKKIKTCHALHLSHVLKSDQIALAIAKTRNPAKIIPDSNLYYG